MKIQQFLSYNLTIFIKIFDNIYVYDALNKIDTKRLIYHYKQGITLVAINDFSRYAT